MKGEGQHLSWTTLGPPCTFPMATDAAHSGAGGGYLGEIVQWSLHHGSVITSYCQAAVTTDHRLAGGCRGHSSWSSGVEYLLPTSDQTSVKERKCTKRAGTQLLSSPPLRSGPHSQQTLPASLPHCPAKALPPPPSRNTGFPVALPALYRLYFYIYLKHKNV